MQLYCGTSGFSYQQWKGPFYPEKLPAKQMLEFYASRLPTVEINNTFYRMPRASVLEGWARKVPDSFRFAIKAPRRISHSKQLKDCDEEAGYLFDAVATLGAKLGVVLVQLPPHSRANLEKLAVFLKLVPSEIRVAFEFRHSSWQDQDVYDLLAANDAAWVTVDTDGAKPPGTHASASWSYLRLRGSKYSDAVLRKWRQYCENFDDVFVYFKHEDAGAGPAFAERMLRL